MCPGANVIKLFSPLLRVERNKLACLSAKNFINVVLYLQARLRAFPQKFDKNLRETNTLAYFAQLSVTKKRVLLCRHQMVKSMAQYNWQVCKIKGSLHVK